jgi:FkbM family methyltransferase
MASALDAAYVYWSHLLADRARKLPKELVGQRVEEKFRRLCLDLAPTLSLEVGAHEGTFSAWVRTALPDTRCVAYEANPYVHEKYADEHADAGVEYHHLAVSEVNGTVDLGIPRQLHNTRRGRRFDKERDSRMASLGQHRYAEETETVAVPSVPLDDFVSVSDDDVVVAWIDVEGASEQVLTSGRKTLTQASLVYIEVENEQVWDGQWLDTDVARFLAGCGLVPVLRDVQRKHQYNVVYLDAALATRPRIARLVNSVYRRKGAGA